MSGGGRLRLVVRFTSVLVNVSMGMVCVSTRLEELIMGPVVGKPKTKRVLRCSKLLQLQSVTSSVE